MLFGYFTLAVALLIELVGAYYSITGLAAIFSGAVVPILIMGGSLEIGKVTAAVWLKNNWHRASLHFKAYLLPAVVLLMFITSMGIFGFLSKAHNDQNLISGDVIAKISIYDEKIKISRENIDANRKALKQMDEAVDQVMGRSSDEKGADKAVAIRRSQQKERGRLLAEIEAEQKKITSLNEERAPIAAEVRKVEAEVGPIKYIAKLIYDDNPDANILEKAVVWVIMMIVAVFDPLALVLILAAQQSIRWARDENNDKNAMAIVPPNDEDARPFTPEEIEALNKPTTAWPQASSFWPFPTMWKKEEPKYESDDGPLTDEQIDQIRKMAKEELPTGKVITNEELFPEDDIPVFEREEIPLEEPVVEVISESVVEPDHGIHIMSPDYVEIDGKLMHHKVFDPQSSDAANAVDRHIQNTQAQFDIGLEADNVPGSVAGIMRGFGTSFPPSPVKGDMFLRVDQLPSMLYKFNGNVWIEVDKSLSDQHAYDDAYIDHLIEKISTGEYDPELLSEAERESIEQRLNNKQD